MRAFVVRPSRLHREADWRLLVQARRPHHNLSLVIGSLPSIAGALGLRAPPRARLLYRRAYVEGHVTRRLSVRHSRESGNPRRPEAHRQPPLDALYGHDGGQGTGD